MNSNIRYKYYEYYIDNADYENLEVLKQDIVRDKNSNSLELTHYLRLSRSIAKRKKIITNKDLA